MCDYTGSQFGAYYPDACCVDGYLWDLDSGGHDENGESYLDCGGDIPCPQCNARQYIHYLADDFENSGYESLVHPLTTKMVKHAMRKLPSNLRRMGMRYWRQGRKEAIKEAMKQG